MLKESYQKILNYRLYIAILVGISSSFLSYWCALKYSFIYLAMAAFISFIFMSLKTYSSLDEIFNFIKRNLFLSTILALFTIFLLYNIAIEKNNIDNFFNFKLIKIKFIPVVFISSFYIIISITKFWLFFIKDLFKKFNTWDKKAYIFMTIIFSLLIIFMYSTQNKWFQQYDKVYSLDSYWVLNKIYPSFTYYDIRHPIMNIFTYPFYIMTKIICDFFIPNIFHKQAVAIILQILNIQFIILISFMLKKLTDNSIQMFFFYIFSYSSIMYLYSFEKYQYCTFILVAYVYESINRDRNSKELFCCAISLIPTSCFIIIQRLFLKKNIKEKIKDLFNFSITSVCFFSLFGRFSLFFDGLNQISVMSSRFSSNSFNLMNKIISLLKMWQGSLFPLSSTSQNIYTWTKDYLTRIDLITIMVLILMIIGIYFSKKDTFSKTALIWLLFSILLIVKFKWAIQESQLFSFYFSWSIIPFIKYGVDKVINKLKINLNITYFIIFSYMVLLDCLDVISIINFLKKL